jgi:EAL domain-containing protein (putative c-di-GMP-specific phosphodiesterase class I)
LMSDKTAQMRIAALTHMARFAGVHTVAKLVEHPQEQDLLRSLGVDFVQGNGSASPVPLDGLDRIHAEHQLVDQSVAGVSAA